jgi:hypothetical protein
MKLKIATLALLIIMSASVQAQRRNRQAQRQAVEEPTEDPRITQMLASTCQVFFIDSLVVSADDFMSHIPLSPHIGRLTQVDGLGTFTNEMGDHRLVTSADTTIMSTDFIANRWTEAIPLGGIGTAPAINPFLMPDGITLYFAQKGPASIGGYDIFVTRYSIEDGSFLRPENIGMPFSSVDNDLFYAIDEFNQLGYFVTDRRQPAGKVCIYTFIPSATRRNYRSEAYSDSQLRSLAAINSISDTWTDQQVRHEAMARLREANKSSGNSTTMRQTPAQTALDSLRQLANATERALTLTRNYYAIASEEERSRMRDEILSTEQQLEQLQTEIRRREKQIPYNN